MGNIVAGGFSIFSAGFNTVDRIGPGQRILSRGIHPPVIGASRAPAFSSGDPDLCIAVWKNHAVLDGLDLCTTPRSPGRYLEVAVASFASPLPGSRDVARHNRL
jgi:hypothetical protein